MWFAVSSTARTFGGARGLAIQSAPRRLAVANMCAMFQQPIRPAGEVHVEFRAGTMEWDGRMVTADKTKGKIVLMTGAEDQLVHFQWYNREKNELKLDLIVINDAYLERIEKCKTGRVYLLRFTSNDTKHFFWMQEPKEEGDDELIKKFNETIGAKIPDKSGGSSTAAGGASLPTSAELAAAMSGQGAQPPVDPQMAAVLQQFLQAQAAQRAPPVPLTAVLTTEVLQSLMDDEEAVKEMAALLPDGQQTPEDLREALGSPQLQQSLSGLTQAVHSDQLAVLFASLGLDPASVSGVGPGSDGLEVLCKALEAKLGGTSGEGS